VYQRNAFEEEVQCVTEAPRDCSLSQLGAHAITRRLYFEAAQAQQLCFYVLSVVPSTAIAWLHYVPLFKKDGRPEELQSVHCARETKPNYCQTIIILIKEESWKPNLETIVESWKTNLEVLGTLLAH